MISGLTLLRRIVYGGRKGRAARRRLMRLSLSEVDALGIRVSLETKGGQHTLLLHPN